MTDYYMNQYAFHGITSICVHLPRRVLLLSDCARRSDDRFVGNGDDAAVDELEGRWFFS